MATSQRRQGERGVPTGWGVGAGCSRFMLG